MKFPRLKLNLDQISIIPIDVEIWFKKQKMPNQAYHRV